MVQKSQTRKQKPFPLNTIEFTKICTSRLRISSEEAMNVAERLYQKGYVSYPRTETNRYNKTINLHALVKKMEGSGELGHYARSLLDENLFMRPRAGKKDDEAHPPIHPTKAASREELGGTDWRVYEIISRHFLATCSKDALGLKT